MDSTIRSLLGLSESEDDGTKTSPQSAVYLKPERIDNKNGAHCGACFFFHKPKTECFLTDPPHCNANHGVCNLFLGGKNLFQEQSKPVPQKLITKKEAGYIEGAPTRCGICEYWGGGQEEKGPCAKVKGEVESHGCCDFWESKA